MEHDAHLLAGGLTTKQLRLLELARALAGRPRVLLLDETLAGLGADAVEDMLAVIRRLAAVVGFQYPIEQIEEGRLPSPVRPDDAEDLALATR